ncbi:hypothetical protein LTR74_016538 [Friedmanniomyces endolithicus]|nr:hypothetical protein LTR74_016538 [Friedmanniomyces endolithicus]
MASKWRYGSTSYRLQEKASGQEVKKKAEELSQILQKLIDEIDGKQDQRTMVSANGTDQKAHGEGCRRGDNRTREIRIFQFKCQCLHVLAFALQPSHTLALFRQTLAVDLIYPFY